jgi:hypothetical protein
MLTPVAARATAQAASSITITNFVLTGFMDLMDLKEQDSPD